MSGGILTAIPFILFVSLDPKGYIGKVYLGGAELMHVLIASKGETVVQNSYHVSSAYIDHHRAYP
jgi:hypothetical protein